MRVKSILWWGQPVSRTAKIPVEWRSSQRITRTIPVAWRAPSRRIPIEWRQNLRRKFTIPVEWKSTVQGRRVMPVESDGMPSDALVLTWDVVSLLDSPLLLAWLVINYASVSPTGATFPIQLTWNVIERITSLVLSWNVLPDIFTPFGITPPSGATGARGPGQPLPGASDVQKPTSIVKKT